jgi:cyclophilin family peptidyl-prolyl cis-trans isomerase/HEAT repeat protein
MIVRILLTISFSVVYFNAVSAQVPMNIQVQIVKAEDARRYDKTLENLMRSPNSDVRRRAALAAGRIGDERSVGPLADLLTKDQSFKVRTMAAFALGETESINAADAVLSVINARITELNAPRNGFERLPVTSGPLANGLTVTARSAEAAGKIAAANPKNDKSKVLGAALLRLLEAEAKEGVAGSPLVIRLALTAVLRARPEGAADVVRPFLAYSDPAIVADALNTLARLRAKNANRDARDLLSTSANAIVRANAARVLGAAEDKEAVDILIKAATSDSDHRVRVSAIRTLATIGNSSASDALVERFYKLVASQNHSKSKRPAEKNELLEIAAALGRLKQGSHDGKVFSLLANFARLDEYRSPETEIALARIDPANYLVYSGLKAPEFKHTWQALSASSQAMATIASLPDSPENKTVRTRSSNYAGQAIDKINALPVREQPTKALPDLMRAYAALKADDLEARLREYLVSDDVWVRATAAELLANNSPNPAVRLAIENAFKKALTTDKHDNDAQLAMLDAMAKINKAAALDTIYLALDAPDYLVRKKALELLNDPALIEKNPYVNSVLTLARDKHRDQVAPYDAKTGTKLGQVLNTDVDYRRALSRKNGAVKAVVTTEKGTFTIDLLPDDAPLTVDNFVKLARSNYFNGLEVHRVVPNFVMQDGDPRGDGNGGPGWSIRCEINMVPYERGAVGMALSGKDTGGSQWFVTHSPQPHLDGGYTVFGHVNETGMKVVDKIVRGDKILSIRIVESRR